MATIVPTLLPSAGILGSLGRGVVFTVLTGTADTFVYDQTVPGSILVMENPTGAAISPRIIGSMASSSASLPNYARVDLSVGFLVGSIAAGAARVIVLDQVSLWLAGTISITSGAGLSCFLLSYA